MATIHQLRGLLLEEIALWLLESGGYQAVDQPGNDPTLCNMSAGLGVRGRGTVHQIDAIGDFVVGPPFGYPLRLLVEAKSYHYDRTVAVSVVREAVAVLQDARQYWPGAAYEPRRARYHYQYAIFSTNSFSRPAQELAFAHDIFLFPLGESAFLRPVVRKLAEAAVRLRNNHRGRGGGFGASLPELRQELRESLRRTRHFPEGIEALGLDGRFPELGRLVEEAASVSGALLGMAARAFPFFLVPSGDIDLRQLEPVTRVEVGIEGGEWFLRAPGSADRMFSFDLPRELFEMYVREGVISPERAVDLKAEYLSEIHAFVTDEGQTRVVHFKLDEDWIERIREGLEE